jgi:hypothetical protein
MESTERTRARRAVPSRALETHRAPRALRIDPKIPPQALTDNLARNCIKKFSWFKVTAWV